MMKNFTFLISFLAFIAMSSTVNGQCTTSADTWTDLNGAGGAPEWDCVNNVSEVTDPGFTTIGVFGSEAYRLENVVAGEEYTFDMCSGLGAGAWIPEITILAPDGTTVDAWNGGPATGSTATHASQCSITWTASQSGEYLIIINELGTFSGDAPNQLDCDSTLAVDNGNPTVTIGSGAAAACPPADLIIDSVITNAHIQGTMLNSATTIAVLDHSDKSSFDLSIRITNAGTDDADTAIITYALVNDINAPTEGAVIVDTITFGGTPLAPGASFIHAFNSLGPDTLFSSIAPNQAVEAFVSIDSTQFNQNVTEDDAFFAFLLSPQQSYTVPYSSSFELLSGTSFTFAHNDWAWKWTDVDGDDSRMEPVRFSNFPGFDGDMTVFGSLERPNVPTLASNGDILESPEMTLDAGANYVLTVYMRSGFGNNFTLDANINDGSGTAVASTQLTVGPADSTYQLRSFPFTVPTSADDYTVEFVKNDDGFGAFDLVEIQELTDPPVAGISINGTDESNPFIEYCDGQVFVSNLSSGVGVSSEIDWGDGSTEAISEGGSLSHTYGANGVYDIVITATNPLGSDTDTITLEVTDIPAPTVTITGLTANGFDVTLMYTTTPSCATNATYSVDWGNGEITQDDNQDGTITYTYSDEGEYTLTLTALSDEGIATEERTILIETSIQTIDLEGELSIYPNPASGNEIRVDFETTSAQDLELSIVSMDGRVLSTRSLENASDVSEALNISGLSNGVYTFKATSNEGVLTRSFVVSR